MAYLEVLSRITRRLPMQQGDLVFTGPRNRPCPSSPATYSAAVWKD